jgi:hypothetical protein
MEIMKFVFLFIWRLFQIYWQGLARQPKGLLHVCSTNDGIGRAQIFHLDPWLGTWDAQSTLMIKNDVIGL